MKQLKLLLALYGYNLNDGLAEFQHALWQRNPSSAWVEHRETVLEWLLRNPKISARLRRALIVHAACPIEDIGAGTHEGIGPDLYAELEKHLQ